MLQVKKDFGLFLDKTETKSEAVFIGGYLPSIPARSTSGLSLRNTKPSGALAYISANVNLSRTKSSVCFR